MSTSKLRQILQLLGDGMSQNKICSEVHCSKRKVSATRRLVDVDGRGIGELLLLSDAELDRLLTKDGEGSVSEDARKQKLASMMPEIMRRLSRRHAHVQYVFEDYYRKECPARTMTYPTTTPTSLETSGRLTLPAIPCMLLIV